MSDSTMSLFNGQEGTLQDAVNLPPEAIKSAQKALSQYYDNHAQQLVQQPGGAEILSRLIANNAKITNPTSATSRAQVTPEGNIQRAGWLADLTGFGSTSGLLHDLTKMAQIQQSGAMAQQAGAEAGLAPTRKGLIEAQTQQASTEAQRNQSIADVTNELAKSGGISIKHFDLSTGQQTDDMSSNNTFSTMTFMGPNGPMTMQIDNPANYKSALDAIGGAIDRENKTIEERNKVLNSGIAPAKKLLMGTGAQNDPVIQSSLERIKKLQVQRDSLEQAMQGKLRNVPAQIPTPPKGATHYSPSTKKFYNAQGQEIK